MTDRETLVAAVKGSRNLNVAAKRLDVSRRTLQNRMREYDLPRGRGGRPRAELSLGSGISLGDVAIGLAAIGGGFLLGRWLSRRPSQPTVAGSPYVLGATVLGSR